MNFITKYKVLLFFNVNLVKQPIPPLLAYSPSKHELEFFKFCNMGNKIIFNIFSVFALWRENVYNCIHKLHHKMHFTKCI